MNFSFGSKSKKFLDAMLHRKPDAVAQVSGSAAYRKLSGTVSFFQMQEGVLVRAEFTGLPGSVKKCGGAVLGFHIHEGNACTGTRQDPFADAKDHYNPDKCEHPYHAGDMPPLFSNNGYAFMTFLTDRFTVREIIGRAVIVHSNPDDFTTQPSGNSGTKIACGIIRR